VNLRPKIKYPLLTLAWLVLVLPYPVIADDATTLKDRIKIKTIHGQSEFEIALDEIAEGKSISNAKHKKIPRQKDPEELRKYLKQNGDKANLVLYEVGKTRSKYTKRVVTRDVVIKLNKTIDPQTLAKGINARYIRELSYAPGHHHFRVKESADALLIESKLKNTPGVIDIAPQFGEYTEKFAVPDDTYYYLQWNLDNDGTYGTAGIDLNIETVWDTYKGNGVVIGIIDDGIELTHPDLSLNIDIGRSYDFRDGDADPSADIIIPNYQDPLNDPEEDSHGTTVAGIAAARGFNGFGISGVAPEATIAAIRLIGDYTSDLQNSNAMAHNNDGANIIHIKNNSWGPRSDGLTVSGPRELAAAAIRDSAINGRGGKGTIYVWAAGNGALNQDNSNKDGWNNSIYTISAGSMDANGKIANYSEPGTNVLITAPVGSGSAARTTTTDLTTDDGYNVFGSTDIVDAAYTSRFGGTSAAAPMVSGVVALMLEANPNLSWRDVQEILITTARGKDDGIDPTHSDWKTNSAGIEFNDYYGAGLIDADAAVTAAIGWTNLGTQLSIGAQPQESLSMPIDRVIPDNFPPGRDLTFDFAGYDFRVEHVKVEIWLEHSWRGDVRFELTSPSGTKSLLVDQHQDDGTNYQAWSFSSVHHWGENANGTWTLNITDLSTFVTGSIWQATVTLYGTQISGTPIPETPDNLTVQALNVSDLKVSWNDNSAFETGYEIDVAYGFGALWTYLADLPANTTEYIDPAFPQYFDVYYRVRAVNGTTYSAYSNSDNSETQSGNGAIIFYSGFEPEEGYVAGTPLVGQLNWVDTLSPNVPINGQGIDDYFTGIGSPGYGQQGWIGFDNGGSASSPFAMGVYKTYTLEPNMLLNYSVKFAVKETTNGFQDSFSFRLANTNGDVIAAVVLDNFTKDIYRYCPFSGSTDTGTDFAVDTVYELELTIDYTNNLWSGKLNGSTLFTSETIVTNPAITLLNYEAFDIQWIVNSPPIGGTNRLVIDELTIKQVAAIASTVPTTFDVQAFSTDGLIPVWDLVNIATGYRIERSDTGGAGTWVEIANVGADEQYYIDTGLSVNTTYYYRMRSENAVGLSAYSAVVSAKTYSHYEDWKDYYNYIITVPDNYDGDNDGIPLIMEYALALDPWHGSANGLPTIGYDSGNLLFTYDRERSDIDYVVTTSTDLIIWKDSIAEPSLIQVASQAGRRVTASIPFNSASSPVFMRLEVSEQ